MAALRYLNFDLQFERLEEGYRVTASGPDGQCADTFRLSITPTELENLVLRVGRTRRVMRRHDHPEIEAAKQFGRRLYENVFADQIGTTFRKSLELAEQQNAGLRLRMHLTRTPELAAYPWEYLYDQSLNRFLALSVETPIVRYLDIPDRIRPLVVDLPLRVLVIIASPLGQAPLNVEREWANTQTALAELYHRGSVILDRLEKPTLGDLQRRLRRTNYHILHFIGHGIFDKSLQDGVLVLEDNTGDSDRVSGQELGMLLHDHRSLRLVILNVCEGGRSAADDPFAGVGQSLVQQGIPAVIAMQFEVSDEAAIAMAHEFYGAIADGYPVDAALAESRKSVFAQGYRLEWGTPVLYLRAPDGQIFDTSASTHDVPVVPPLVQLTAPDVLEQREEPAQIALEFQALDVPIAPTRKELQQKPLQDTDHPKALVAVPATLPVQINRLFNSKALIYIPIAIVVNIVIGQRIQSPQVPIYLDSIGTILMGALFGPWVGLITGVLSHTIWALSGLAPRALWYVPTVGVVGLLAGFAGRRGVFRSASPRFLSAIIGALLVFNVSFLILMFATHTFIDEGLLRWPVSLFDSVANLLIFLMALVGGAVLGYFVLRNVGYVGVAALITGIAAAIVSAPITTYVSEYSTELRSDVVFWVFTQGVISDMSDKLISFIMVWAIIQLLFSRRLLRFLTIQE
jgi:hypothetical protein